MDLYDVERTSPIVHIISASSVIHNMEIINAAADLDLASKYPER